MSSSRGVEYIEWGSAIRTLTVRMSSHPTGDADADADGDGGEDSGGGGGADVELLPEPTHRGYGSLEKIYPQRSTQDVDRLRLFDRAVDVFIECVAATRDQAKMNSQTFRNFVRSVRAVVFCLLRCTT